VILRHLPNHGHSEQRTSCFSIHLRIDFGRTRSAAHACCTFVMLVPYRTAEIQEICWSNGTLPSGKCHFSANIAENSRVIYELMGHFDKYTSQYIRHNIYVTIYDSRMPAETITTRKSYCSTVQFW